MQPYVHTDLRTRLVDLLPLPGRFRPRLLVLACFLCACACAWPVGDCRSHYGFGRSFFCVFVAPRSMRKSITIDGTLYRPEYDPASGVRRVRAVHPPITRSPGVIHAQQVMGHVVSPQPSIKLLCKNVCDTAVERCKIICAQAGQSPLKVNGRPEA